MIMITDTYDLYTFKFAISAYGINSLWPCNAVWCQDILVNMVSADDLLPVQLQATTWINAKFL